MPGKGWKILGRAQGSEKGYNTMEFGRRPLDRDAVRKTALYVVREIGDISLLGEMICIMCIEWITIH